MMEKFGEKLRKLRQQHGVSLRELSTQLGYASHSYVTALEKNERKPSAEVILKLADLFDVTTDQLMRDEIALDTHGEVTRKGTMPMTIASSQIQQELGAVFDRVLQNEDVIIERYGAPLAAMINYTRYEQLLRTEQELLQQRLQQASAATAQRAANLTEAEIDVLIEEARIESQPEAVTL